METRLKVFTEDVTVENQNLIFRQCITKKVFETKRYWLSSGTSCPPVFVEKGTSITAYHTSFTEKHFLYTPFNTLFTETIRMFTEFLFLFTSYHFPFIENHFLLTENGFLFTECPFLCTENPFLFTSGHTLYAPCQKKQWNDYLSVYQTIKMIKTLRGPPENLINIHKPSHNYTLIN
jgi:hypothetical protein